jgi:tetratricopeptide (TPR) repeat protein
MSNLKLKFLNNLATLLLCLLCCTIYAQGGKKTQVQSVFNQLIAAYGSPKTAPELILNAKKIGRPAFYNPEIKPSIIVDENLLIICRTFGKDSLNALSIVLSHELAHYYNEHEFCTDFAFAIRNKNEGLYNKVKLINKNQKMIYETQADDKGLFYAAIAGYEPFEIQPKLLDAIYTSYQLKDEVGYPTKLERKEIANNAITKSKKLFDTFKQGLQYIQDKKYDAAIESFAKVNSSFPSRENWNNIGVAKVLKALDLKVPSEIEKEFPNRFIYPIEVDNSSRLQVEKNRNLDDNEAEMISLLKSAKIDFEKAISLDVNYTMGYINLACTFDLLENPNAAIGKIKELPKELQNTIPAKRILAIAYFHNQQESVAKVIWNELKM